MFYGPGVFPMMTFPTGWGPEGQQPILAVETHETHHHGFVASLLDWGLVGRLMGNDPWMIRKPRCFHLPQSLASLDPS